MSTSCLKDFLNIKVYALYRKLTSSVFIKNITETFVIKIILIGVGLFTTVIIARILGPSGRGFYAIATTIGAIGLQFGNLGLHASNTYFVSKNRELFSPLLANSLIISFLFGGIGIVLIGIIFQVWPNLAPIHGILLILALLWVPFGLAYMLLQNLLLGIQEIHTYNFIELFSKVITVVFIMSIVLIRKITVENIFAAGLIGLVISFLWVLFRLIKKLDRPLIPSFSLFNENICYGIKAYLAAFFAFSILRTNMLIIQYKLGPEQVGYYSIAANMADMVYMLPSVIATILFPKISSYKNIHEKLQLTKKVTYGMTFIFLVFLVFAVVFVKPIVLLLFGKQFLPSIPSFIWLMPGILFLGIQTVIVQFLNSVGFPKNVVVIWGFALLLNIVLAIWAIPLYGIVGTSVVSSFVYFIVLILIIIQTERVKRNNESLT